MGSSLLLLLHLLMAAERQPAFPGAEGFGSGALGGRGGRTLMVTNLRDYDPRREEPIAGSLRAAITAKGPRTVLFGVSGTIPLEAPLKIEEPFITIAGQTAPGDGICLRNEGTEVCTHDVIIRHIRLRPGDTPCEQHRKADRRFEPDSLAILAGSRDVIIDHCSASWSIDETLSVSGAGVTNITVGWCIISESLNTSCHHKGNHGYGSLIRTNGNVTYHHNLYAHHNSRTPRPGTYGEGSLLLDFRNNVVYNAMRGGYSASDPARMNYIGNMIRRGPDGKWKYGFSVGGAGTEIFSDQNESHGFPPGWAPVGNTQVTTVRKEPFAVAAVRTQSSRQAFESVLASAGATLPTRDAIDRRIVADVRSGKGRVINSQGEVGGWPYLHGTAPPPDADQDGMPDAWETRHGLVPSDSSDATADPDRDGFTNLEEYLNATDPRSASTLPS